MADDRKPLAFGFTGIGALVALLAIAFRSPAPLAVSSATDAAARRASADLLQIDTPDSISGSYNRGRALLGDFLGQPWDALAAPGRRPTFDINVVIATVPDPYDSHQDWFYDAQLDAFRRAFAAAGYVPDRFWIPTRDDSIVIKARRAEPQHKVAAHDYFPGVFLFRQADPSEPVKRLRLLYVVHETPTSGVHKAAFNTAVAERARILWDPAFTVDPLAREELLVAGPVFSGSAVSLRLALNDALAAHLHPVRTIRVISGSATSSSNHAAIADNTLDSLRVLRPATTLGVSTDYVRFPRIRFSTTVHTDDAMLDALLGVLDDLQIDSHHVALLAESSTSYGASREFSSEFEKKGSLFATLRADSTPRTARRGAGLLRIPFPLNIASLRSEFERTNTVADQAPDLPGLQSSIRTRLTLDDRSRPRESPPVTSDLTVPSLDLVMNEILRVISDHDIRAVVIQATDVRDKLVLAREIKRRQRSMQFFTFENHVLYLRPEYRQYLSGMYVISTYPLLLENQWWSPRFDAAYSVADSMPRELLAFSSDAGVGGYNALLSLLDHPAAQVGYRYPFADEGDRVRRPPLWLTVAGRDAAYPVRIVTPAAAQLAHVQQRDTPRAEAQGEPAPAASQSLWSTLLWLVLLAQTFLAVAVSVPGALARLTSGGTRDADDDIRERDPARLSIVGLPESLRSDELLFTGIFVGAIVCAFTPITALFGLAIHSSKLVAASSIVGVAGAIASVVFIGVGSWQHIQLLFGIAQPSVNALAGSEPRKNHIGRLLVAIVSLIYLFNTAAWCSAVAILARKDPLTAALLDYRQLHPWSGVSMLPAIVLLGVGFALWSGWQLYQVQASWKHRSPYEIALVEMSCTDQLKLPGHATAVMKAVREVRKSLLWLIPDPKVLLLAALLIGLGLLIIVRHEKVLDSLVLPPISGLTPSEWILWLGIFALLVTTSWGVVRLLLAWQAVARSLDALSDTPILRAVARLPKRARVVSEVGLIGVPRASETGVVATEMLRRARGALLELHEQAERSALAAAAPAAPLTRYTLADAVRDYIRSGDKPKLAVYPEPLVVLKDVLPGQSNLVPEGDARAQTIRLSNQQRIAAIANCFAVAVQVWPDPNSISAVDRYGKTTARAIEFVEDYLATEALIFVHSTLRSFRWLSLLLLGALVSLVIIASSYPLQPEGLVKFSVVTLLLIATGSIVAVVMQMNRNELLSTVTGTTPGKISWDTTFALNFGLFTIVPLLAYLSTEFPGVRSFLFSWIEPTLKAMPNL